MGDMKWGHEWEISPSLGAAARQSLPKQLQPGALLVGGNKGDNRQPEKPSEMFTKATYVLE